MGASKLTYITDGSNRTIKTVSLNMYYAFSAGSVHWRTEIVDAILDAPGAGAGGAGEGAWRFAERGVPAVRAGEEGARSGDGCFPARPAAGEDAGGELPPVAGELGEGIHADEQLEREVALEEADAVVRDGELALDGKAALPQPAAHGFGVEVEVEGGELDRLGGEGAPRPGVSSSSAGWL